MGPRRPPPGIRPRHPSTRRCCSASSGWTRTGLFDRFGGRFVWLSLAIVFVECGLFFPILPGDTLLFAMGLFFASRRSTSSPVGPASSCSIEAGPAHGGRLPRQRRGYEIGRKIGPPIYERDGRIMKRKYFDQTHAFFDRHGNKALVHRPVRPVRADLHHRGRGCTRMERRRFFVWSSSARPCGSPRARLIGYFLGYAFPALGESIDSLIIVILAFSVIPMFYEGWRHRRTSSPEADDNDGDGVPDYDIS